MSGRFSSLCSLGSKRRKMTKDKKGHVNDLSHVDKSHDLSERVRINVGGCVYVTTKSTLMKHPNSLLAKLSTEDPNYDTKMEEYYFDRNHSIFEFVLEYYRTGFLHIPKGVCQVLVRTEFSFWGLDVNCIASCCLTDYHDHDMENAALKELEEAFTIVHEEPCAPSVRQSMKLKIYNFLEHPNSSRAAYVWGTFFTLCVLISIIAMVLETMPYFRYPVTDTTLRLFNSFQDSNGTTWKTFFNQTTISSKHRDQMTTVLWLPLLFADLIVNGLCTVELFLRFLTAPSKKKFLLSPLNIFEFVAVGAVWTPWIVSSIAYGVTSEPNTVHAIYWVYSLRVLRLFRVFNLARFNIGLRVIMLTIKASLRELILLIMVIFIGMVIFASFVYYAEFQLEDSDFENIPIGFWWSVVTMTTVGYGDKFPRSPLGYIVGGLCAVVGIVITGLPIPIISNHFNIYYDYAQKIESKVKHVTKKTRRQSHLTSCS